MAVGVLILGESGTGKTYSIKNLNPDDVKILSVQKPILPFRGKYEVVRTPTGDAVIKELKNTTKKIIVVDDFQYILGIPLMRRIGEKGWDKFTEIEQGYSDVLDAINSLSDDTIVYFTSHVMYNDDTGKTQIKTIGKALDKYITIEGLFMIVLGTQVVENRYYFITQNNGSNTLKSPEGMFPTLAIPNDLAYVTDKIRNYYYMSGSKTDDEMRAEDAANAVDDSALVKKPRRKKVEETSEANQTDEVPLKSDTPQAEPAPARRRHHTADDTSKESIKVEEVTFDEAEPFDPSQFERKPRSESVGPSEDAVVNESSEEPAPARRRRRRVE